jgi:hypothetical protein
MSFAREQYVPPFLDGDKLIMIGFSESNWYGTGGTNGIANK